MQDSSPLLAAAAAGQGSAVGALLSGGALTDAPDVTGGTAMMAAAAQGHVDCMHILLGFHAGKPCVHTPCDTSSHCAPIPWVCSLFPAKQDLGGKLIPRMWSIVSQIWCFVGL
jgi:ankyrin repeat protein